MVESGSVLRGAQHDNLGRMPVTGGQGPGKAVHWS
jgi:hypothetical protein